MNSKTIITILTLLLITCISAEYCLSQDILVNDKSGDTVGMAGLGSQSVAMDWAGNFVVVWCDYRYAHGDVWMQRFDFDGNPIGANQKVNDDFGTDDQNWSRVAMDKDGNFVVVWHDNRDGDYNIYAQRYDSSGNRVGFNFKINDDGGVARQVQPLMGMDSSGNFVVAWIDGRDGGKDVYAQRFDNTATPVGANLRVNEDAYTITGGMNMNVSMSDAGIFSTMWGTSSSGKICVKLFNWATGNSIAPTSIVVSNNYVSNLNIGMDSNGISTLVWYQGGHVMARRYNSSGNPITSAYVIDDSSYAYPGYPEAIAVRPTGEFIVYFSDASRHARIRRFDASGNPIGPSFEGGGPCAINPEGKFVVLIRGLAQRFDWSETPIGESVPISDGVHYLSQAKPKIAFATPETFMVVWEDVRGKDTSYTKNIYGRIFQVLDNAAVPLGEDFLIPSEPEPWETSGNPSIAGSDSGHFVVVASQDHNYALSVTRPQVAIRIYDVSGNLITSALHTSSGENHGTSVAINHSGSFAFAVARNWFGSNIFMTFCSADANTRREIPVNTSDDNGADQSVPQVAMNDNTVLVAWMDPREGRDDVWARLYSFPGGTPLTGEFRVHQDISQTGHYLAGIAIDDAGRFIITWNDRREGDWNIYARRFNRDSLHSAG